MHVHVGFLSFMVSLAYLIIGSFVLRAISYTWPESATGKALAAIV